MTRLAAVQPALRLGEVEANLARIEDLIRDAHREHSPEVITVPESMTTPNVYSKVMRGVARPVDGQPFQLLTRLARELDCVIGGGFVAARGGHTYGTYVLAEPDGAPTSTTRTSRPPGSTTTTAAVTTTGVVDSTALGRDSASPAAGSGRATGPRGACAPAARGCSSAGCAGRRSPTTGRGRSSSRCAASATSSASSPASCPARWRG